jgi:hypothetical protein
VGAGQSDQRRIWAQRIASALTGVIAIMTTDIAVQHNKLGYVEVELGVLLIGFAMTVTRIFFRIVTKEAAIGAHLPIAVAGATVRDSLFVMLFPVISALLIVVAALTNLQWTVLLDIVLYLGALTVFAIGFLSSYVLDREIRPALSRGGLWTILSLVLLAARAFV